jgi:formylglycine-generating enzyme required for sulfatase activity
MAIVFVLVPGANKAQVGTFQPLSGTGSAATSGLHPTFFSYLGFDQIARLDCFLLSKFELTQFQWARLGGGNPSNFQGDCLGERITPRNPVESVSWQRAREVLGWHDMDLPTEFQWEYACGVKTEGGYYWGNGHPPAYENSFGGQGALAPFLGIDNFDGHMLHTPVGTFLPNPWGFHDLLGNVAELCRDGYAIRPMAEVRERDGLRVAGDTEYCVGRGGAFVTGGHRFSRMPLARDWLLPVLGVRPIKHLQRD